MSTWGGVAAERNQQDIGEYDQDPNAAKTSIWDWDNQTDYAQDQFDRKNAQDDARDSWGDPPDEQDQQDIYDQAQQAKQQRRGGGPGSRGGRPASFDHAQYRKSYLGMDSRQLKKARHPVSAGGAAIKKKAKKKAKKKQGSWWWPGTQTHTFRNPNGQR